MLEIQGSKIGIEVVNWAVLTAAARRILLVKHELQGSLPHCKRCFSWTSEWIEGALEAATTTDYRTTLSSLEKPFHPSLSWFTSNILGD